MCKSQTLQYRGCNRWSRLNQVFDWNIFHFLGNVCGKLVFKVVLSLLKTIIHRSYWKKTVINESRDSLGGLCKIAARLV